MKSLIQSLSRGLAWIGEKIALVVTPVVLAIFYFTVFAVGHLVSRLVRADLLHRRSPGNPSFWHTPPVEKKDAQRYLAQF